MNYYTILEERSHYELIDKVREYIENGWKPQGGISTCTYGSEMHYAQAMIKGDK